MQKLKISLIKGGILSIPCSTVFIKHIEGIMCQTELSLNDKVDGKLEIYYRENEKKKDDKLSTEGKFPFKYLHILNYHKKDLPFSNMSVDSYARRFFKLAINDPEATKVATTIHGPGAGLDTSESFEIMLSALSEELAFTNSLGSLQEILFIERDAETFEMLEKRLKFLHLRTDLLEIIGDDIFLIPAKKGTTRKLVDRSKQLSKVIFVAMPFSEYFEDIYHYGIHSAVKALEHTPEMLKHEKYIGDIIDRIKTRIAISEMVIADISGNNPNVFYEVGYAHALNKPVLLLSQTEESPFDLRTQRQIFYKSYGIKKLEEDLRENLKEILQKS
jgi:hypothetical protein